VEIEDLPITAPSRPLESLRVCVFVEPGGRERVERGRRWLPVTLSIDGDEPGAQLGLSLPAIPTVACSAECLFDLPPASVQILD
jgi:hypothetical protein